MREILFRGKRLDNGEWVEGYLGQDTIIGNGKTWLGYVINPAPKKVWDSDWFEVDPSTVGQYTGLKDKNGKRIFEGDIVDCTRNCIGHKKIEIVKYNGGGFNPFAVPGWECTPSQNEVVVIGNIHDNPELMDGGEAE